MDNANNFLSFTSIQWDPLIPIWMLVIIGLIGAMLAVSAIAYKPKGMITRMVAIIGFLLILANPNMVEEKRRPVTDIAVVVVDKSPSQNFGFRDMKTNEAYDHIMAQLNTLDSLEVRTVNVASKDGQIAEETRLFDKLNDTMADIPPSRRAGVIMITDGQVHDVPEDTEQLQDYGPVHTFLSGERDEIDRQLVVEEAPSYGIVGQDVTVRFNVIDTDSSERRRRARVKITNTDGSVNFKEVQTGESQTFNLHIAHGGQNVFEIEVDRLPGEITEINNKIAVIVNGVRDRLRVLLVSGMPHTGERTWRNILTADPAVDLVHFTILRQPHKLNTVPQNELSLIPFPFRELFEVKIYDFDLIIFDRYRLNNIMPPYYFDNIAKYVREGGALLEASGPSFGSNKSIYYSDLGNILPSVPTGSVLNEPYRPSLTDLGLRHPVTFDLKRSHPEPWGQWLRQVDVIPKSGDTLMHGVGQKPLLTLDRVEKGRVAHFTSDLIWLWARGYDGGGPQAEILRRLAHWLMKEPELEEDAIDVSAEGNEITLRRRSLERGTHTVTMTDPNGKKTNIVMQDENTRWVEKTITVDKLGVYRFKDKNKDIQRVVLVGDYNPKELQSVVTTEEHLQPVVKTSNGTFQWVENGLSQNFRMVNANSSFKGFGWLGLRRNNDYVVTGVQSRNLLPDLITIMLLISLVTVTWYVESRLKS